MTRPFSPCKGVCTATALGDTICAGCMRTANEVMTWNTLTEDQRDAIWNRLESMNHYKDVAFDLFQRNPFRGITPMSFALAAGIKRQESITILNKLMRQGHLKLLNGGGFAPTNKEDL